MIIGTAGHIDHGKTALVRALTGVDTTHLPEERRRGITIELGFAPLFLDTEGLGTVGIVDVPGHEGFVRTMVAGATGIDVALLVVAADEGVMPQTREHVAILTLLGLQKGVVALTKCDLVDAEWIALVYDDVRELLRETPLAQLPIVRASARTGEGVSAVRGAIAAIANELPTRAVDDLFRMPVDRAFTRHGTGTVATGTVWSGTLEYEQSVRMYPGGRTARVRGLQAHGREVERVVAGMRAAVALSGAGSDVGNLARGSTLVTGDQWLETRTLRADVTLLSDAATSVSARTSVRLHLGTAEVGTRVVTAGGRLEPGMRKPARLALDEALLIRAGDRFVLRGGSPPVTIGGGVVSDPAPPGRRARLWPMGASVAERLQLVLREAGVHGVPRVSLPVRLGILPQAALDTEHDAQVLMIAERLYPIDALGLVTTQLLALLDAQHVDHPLEPGASLQFVRSRLTGHPTLGDEAIRRAIADRHIDVEGGLIRRHGWSPVLSAQLRLVRDTIVRELQDAGREPPSLLELASRHGSDVAAVLRHLEREGAAVQVERDRYFVPDAVTQLTAELRRGMQRGREYSPGELRELLGVSRKYLIPILEYLDRTGVTERREGGRIFVGT